MWSDSPAISSWEIVGCSLWFTRLCDVSLGELPAREILLLSVLNWSPCTRDSYLEWWCWQTCWLGFRVAGETRSDVGIQSTYFEGRGHFKFWNRSHCFSSITADSRIAVVGFTQLLIFYQKRDDLALRRMPVCQVAIWTSGNLPQFSRRVCLDQHTSFELVVFFWSVFFRINTSTWSVS